MMLCIWQPESKSLILLLFVLLTMRAEDIIAVVDFYNESFHCSATQPNASHTR